MNISPCSILKDLCPCIDALSFTIRILPELVYFPEFSFSKLLSDKYCHKKYVLMEVIFANSVCFYTLPRTKAGAILYCIY